MNVLRKWSNEWGRRIWFSHGTTNAKGVCILIRKRLESYRKDIDPNGRFSL